MTPKVSVVIATYNYGRFITEALDSLRQQTFADWEALVVDDGSTDDTAALVEPYLADARFHYFCTEHQGQPKTKNVGIKLAQAPLIAFLDADDLWLPTKLEKQVSLFEANPELGVVYTRRLLIDKLGRELAYPQPPLHRGDVLGPIFWRNFVCFSSSMIRRTALDVVGLFDESIPLAIDYDLWLRIATWYHFDYVDEPLVKYRTGHANLSRRLLERTQVVRGIIRRFLEQHGGRGFLEPALVRRTLAEHCCDMALAREGFPWTGMVPEYLSALRNCPHHVPAWKGLLTCWWPRSVQGLVRKVVGRPDWRLRRLQDEPPPMSPRHPLSVPQQTTAA